MREFVAIALLLSVAGCGLNPKVRTCRQLYAESVEMNEKATPSNKGECNVCSEDCRTHDEGSGLWHVWGTGWDGEVGSTENSRLREYSECELDWIEIKPGNFSGDPWEANCE